MFFVAVVLLLFRMASNGIQYPLLFHILTMFMVNPIQGKFREDIKEEHSHTFAFLLWGGSKGHVNNKPKATKWKDVKKGSQAGGKIGIYSKLKNVGSEKRLYTPFNSLNSKDIILITSHTIIFYNLLKSYVRRIQKTTLKTDYNCLPKEIYFPGMVPTRT